MESNDLWSLLSPRLKAYLDVGVTVAFVAEFCDVLPTTVKSWLRDSTKPAGDAMVRLWYLLRELGADSPEVERLHPFVRVMGELFAFGLVSAEDVMEISGLNGFRTSRAYVMMRGRTPMHPRDSVVDLTEVYRDELEQKRVLAHDSAGIPMGIQPTIVPKSQSDEAAATRLKAAAPDESNEAPPEPPKAVLKAVVTVTYGPDLNVTLASLLSAAYPIAKKLDRDGSALQRSQFRDLIGLENLFDLSNTLEKLCSERARRTAR